MGVSFIFSWFLIGFFVASFHVTVIVHAFTGTYGINYGRIADNIPPPDRVVAILKEANIKHVRIYDADHSVLKAFAGTGLEIVVNVHNGLLKDMSASEDNAMNWVKENVQPFLPDTHIRGITVGNEVLGGNDPALADALVGSVKNIYNAINKLHLTELIQISTAHSQAVFANSYPPSACTFKESVVPHMKQLLQFFSDVGSPFFINIYPFLAYLSDPTHIDLNYALFQSNPGIIDGNTKLHYDNMFDAQVDASYSALQSAGFGKMEVIVSETGWASRGDENEGVATIQNARTYNTNLRKRLAIDKGTPLKPKIAVRAYVFALFNENLKPGPTSERNFGLFKADGTISYDIGFNDQPLVSEQPSFSSSLPLSLKDVRALPISIVIITCAAVLLLF